MQLQDETGVFANIASSLQKWSFWPFSLVVLGGFLVE